ncbi:hypothetical protein PIB30_060283 [Stylosanthes scabra]|uniref:Protein FAR1-RELATED SEQUENCE n=1 Tax=Stylosanthes scabra TaxID=79078 RepID=A0ABU6UKC6_9FABA|nr:hypothetical protein [Stylosanthes scabra]
MLPAENSADSLHCVSSSLIELQLQQEYTSHMFIDIQEQFLKKADCIVKVISKEGEMYSLLVDQQKLISDKHVVDTYRVSFDSVVREYHCECNLFQSKAILCCYMFSTFAYFEVNEVPSCYISSRWSKNVR